MTPAFRLVTLLAVAALGCSTARPIADDEDRLGGIPPTAQGLGSRGEESLDGNRPREVASVLALHDAFLKMPEASLAQLGGPRFSGTIETIQPIESATWGGFATFAGGQVLAYFTPDEWRRLSGTLSAGETRSFVCREVGSGSRPPLLTLDACDTPD